MIDEGSSELGSCGGRQRETASTQIQQQRVEIYSQGAGWRSVGGKLLPENLRRKEESWLNQSSRILVEGTSG